jgi:hypothetical protein
MHLLPLPITQPRYCSFIASNLAYQGQSHLTIMSTMDEYHDKFNILRKKDEQRWQTSSRKNRKDVSAYICFFKQETKSLVTRLGGNHKNSEHLSNSEGRTH